MKRILFFVIVLMAVASQAAAKDHFYDLHGNSLEKYNYVWKELHDFYGDSLPDKITVSYGCKNGSTVFISEGNLMVVDVSKTNIMNLVIAHESSHIALRHMTEGMSETEGVRFIDEGWARLISEKIAGNQDAYRKKEYYEACQERKLKKVSIKNLKNWSSYFGDWESSLANGEQKYNSSAYSVGSTVVDYIISSYGEASFKKLLVDIGKTKDLDASLKNILNVNEKELEAGWLNYLDKRCIDAKKEPEFTTQPQVIDMYPKNNSRTVPSNINSLTVKFNVPMSKSICIISEGCDEICYKNARWKDDKTLVVELPNKLRPASEYRLSLGSSDTGCRLRSAVGHELPVVEWSFKTR